MSEPSEGGGLFDAVAVFHAADGVPQGFPFTPAPDSAERLRALWAELHSLTGVRFETAQALVDGVARQLRLRAERFGAVAVVQWRFIEASASQPDPLEAELLLAQKMEAIGRLAGGVAHDFNNLLSIIASATGLLSDEVGKDSMAGKLAAEVIKACKRASDLTRQLLVFSGRQFLQPHTVELGSFFDQLKPRLEALVGATVALKLEVPPVAPTVVGEAAQLEQVLVNLVENARDAMPRGGEVSLTVKQFTVGGDDWVTASVPPGDWVSLAVKDTGEGMDAGVRAHLFEPFFTTKPRGKGTGLGLSTVWGFVRQFRGHLRVESAPGVGTTFTVLLPQEIATEAKVAPRPVPANPNGRVVLLVEDDAAVRWVAAAVLTKAGYEVHQAENGAQAVAQARTPGLEVDLLLTDVVMPGMGGTEVARVVKEFQPRAHVVYMSGYTSDAGLRAAIRDATVDFIAKPFTPEGLTAHVRKVLGTPTR